MNCHVVDLDEERLKKCLAQIYKIQISNCFPEDVMPLAMKTLNLDEEGAIDLLGSLIRLGWISTGNIRPKFFLRPGYVNCFPVVVSASGIDKISGQL
ncbi:MAG: hypothetical protein ACOY4I_07565 [Bacillota bacterium]